MPPKPKFTKEHVVHVALELVSKSGIEALTSRGLGKALGLFCLPGFHNVQGHGRGQKRSL